MENAIISELLNIKSIISENLHFDERGSHHWSICSLSRLYEIRLYSYHMLSAYILINHCDCNLNEYASNSFCIMPDHENNVDVCLLLMHANITQFKRLYLQNEFLHIIRNIYENSVVCIILHKYNNLVKWCILLFYKLILFSFVFFSIHLFVYMFMFVDC